MIILFGTRFCGKVAAVNNQWVESKFFSVMFIPIFPVSSMFVTNSKSKSRNGFNIGVNSHSVKAVYGRILSLLFSAWFLYLAFDSSGSYEDNPIKTVAYLLLGLLLASLCMYFYLYYGKPNSGDVALRNRIGAITGYYALPHWFDHSQLNDMLSALELKYKQKYPDCDWKTDLQCDTIDRHKHILLFVLALFNCMVYDLPENDRLYTKADTLFS